MQKIDDHITEEILKQNISFIKTLSREDLIKLNKYLWSYYSSKESQQ